MDWVEERAKRDIELQRRAREFWDGLCSACEQAVTSHGRFYSKVADVESSFSRPHDNSIIIHYQQTGYESSRVGSMEVIFDPKRCFVEVRYSDRRGSKRYPIVLTESRTVAVEIDKARPPLSPAEMSEWLLKDILFQSERTLAQDPNNGASHPT